MYCNPTIFRVCRCAEKLTVKNKNGKIDIHKSEKGYAMLWKKIAETLLDESDSVAYVADMHTFELQ